MARKLIRVEKWSDRDQGEVLQITEEIIDLKSDSVEEKSQCTYDSVDNEIDSLEDIIARKQDDLAFMKEIKREADRLGLA